MASQYAFRDNITRYNYKVVAGKGRDSPDAFVDPALTGGDASGDASPCMWC